MLITCRSVMASRGSGAAPTDGSHSTPSGSSSCSIPRPTAIPITVAVMLLAVDQVRVTVCRSTPSA